MLSSEEDQVTVLLLALSGCTVATSVSLSPSTKNSDVLFRMMDPTLTCNWLIVTVQEAVLSPACAVMEATPAASAFTYPFWSTLAKVSSEDDQLTVLSVAFSGMTLATRRKLSPSVTVTFALSKEMLLTGITEEETLTVQLAVLSSAFAVMVAEPTFTAVTFPSASTTAILLSELDHVTVAFVAFCGSMVAVILALSPSTISKLYLSNVMPLTGTCFLETRTWHVAVFCPAMAVIVTNPGVKAVTRPLLSTEATSGLELDQVTWVSVAFLGKTVALSWATSPSCNSRLGLSKEMLPTGISSTGAVQEKISSTDSSNKLNALFFFCIWHVVLALIPERSSFGLVPT